MTKIWVFTTIESDDDYKHRYVKESSSAKVTLFETEEVAYEYANLMYENKLEEYDSDDASSEVTPSAPTLTIKDRYTKSRERYEKLRQGTYIPECPYRVLVAENEVYSRV